MIKSPLSPTNHSLGSVLVSEHIASIIESGRTWNLSIFQGFCINLSGEISMLLKWIAWPEMFSH